MHIFLLIIKTRFEAVKVLDPSEQYLDGRKQDKKKSFCLVTIFKNSFLEQLLKTIF